MKDILISIIIPTYNHEPYIEHAIESALNQKCDWPFEIIVGDDCSTDRTNKICRSYYHNNLIKLIDSETNTGLLENYRRLFSACTGKYIAILEGDDFWHEDKLSEQISFLENNSDYGFVHSNAFLLFENNKTRLVHKRSFSLVGDVYNNLFTQNKIVSITVCFRKSLLEYVDFDNFIKLEFQTMDLPLWLEFALHSKLGYIKAPLATYRVTPRSISNNQSFKKRKRFEESNRSILEYYAKKRFPETLEKNYIFKKHNLKLFYLALSLGRFEDIQPVFMDDLPVSALKKIAVRYKLIFAVYRLFIRLFYKRL